MSVFVTLVSDVVVGGLFLARQSPEQVELADDDARVVAFKQTLALFNPAVAEEKTKVAARAMFQSLTSPMARAVKAIVLLTLQELNILRGTTIGIATLSWDPASIANGAGLTSPSITVAGAAFRDAVDVAAPYSLSGLVATGYVSAANTVVIRLHNGTGAAVNLAAGVWGACVRRPVETPQRTKQQLIDAVTTILTGNDTN